MHLTIKGRNIELTPALKQYASEKLGKVTKLFDQIIEITAILSVEKNPSISNNQIAEVNIILKKGTIQAKEASENMYASIDLLVDKIERQLRKHKTKLISKVKTSGTSIREMSVEETAIAETEAEENLGEDIVRIDIVNEEETV